MDAFYSFPFQISDHWSKNIDTGIRAFRDKFQDFFSVITQGINGFVSSIAWLLKILPWFVLVLIVFFLGWRCMKKISSGILYAGVLCIIGFLGLWDFMNDTLAIVIASVMISVLFGFPIGILLSSSDKLSKILRPVLDTMQTMPTFVYLIPTALLFGLGKTPAVIASVIYAVVPIIRLTNLGIRQVNPEIVEAAKAFGSTRLQSLIKVQIPLAFPTILAGVNQTLMMAMAMVTTSSMIGASGLGMEVLLSVNRMEVGRGIFAGGAVVILAVIMDRLTQGWFKDVGVKKDV